MTHVQERQGHLDKMKRENPIVNVQQKRRIFLDMRIDVVEKATQKAAKFGVSRKRYIEALIERDCAKKTAK